MDGYSQGIHATIEPVGAILPGQVTALHSNGTVAHRTHCNVRLIITWTSGHVHGNFQHYESQLAEKSFQINSRLTYFYPTTKHVMSSAMGSYPIPNTEILMY